MTGIALLPRDGLFCKDGRGWHTSSSGRGHALDWPWPSTVLGALRTAWGRAQEAQRGRPFSAEEWLQQTASIRLGRSLMLRRVHGAPWQMDHRVWPVPNDALFIEVRQPDDSLVPRLLRLLPEPPRVPTLGATVRSTMAQNAEDAEDVSQAKAREALWVPQVPLRDKPMSNAPRYWCEALFVRWLCGQSLEGPEALQETQAFDPVRRVQAHVGIQPQTQTTDEGILYAHDVLETLRLDSEWGLGLEALWPEEQGAEPSTVTLGSDRRPSAVEPLPAQMFQLPSALRDAWGQGSPAGLRLVVTSPACFEQGWLPDGFSCDRGQFVGRLGGSSTAWVLRAALVPRPVHISGWDMAARQGRGAPRATDRMVAPGAVYFLQRLDGAPVDADEARALWLHPLGQRTEEGYGRVVPGIWNVGSAQSTGDRP